MQFKNFNRFTTIPFLIDLLKRKKLTLLNPVFWEDYNDRETMEVYRKSINAKSVYALCLTHQSETIHHWNAFAGGTSGCCIEFSPNRLFEVLDKTKGVKHGKAEYIRMKDLADKEIEPSQLPFLKRYPFKAESEYRIIAVSDEIQKPVFDIDIDPDIIRRITLSNKMPENIFISNKEILLEMAPALKGKIFHSTLYNNSAWINHFKK